MIDLRNCKTGDKIKSKHGLILTYIGTLPEKDYYDHEVRYPDGGYGTRTHDGHVFRNVRARNELDHDIVEIIGSLA